MSEYSELLKHPKWQKKRLIIMQRDGFHCAGCGADNNMLSVHHIYYEKGKMPWEYPDRALITLCEDCHENEHRCNEIIKSNSFIIDEFKRCGIPSSIIYNLAPMLNLLPNGKDNIYEVMDVIDTIITKLSVGKIKLSEISSLIKND